MKPRAAMLIAVAGMCACAGPGGDGSTSGLALPRFLRADKQDQPMIARVKPGRYEVSSLAIGEQKDLARQRGEGLGFVRQEEAERHLEAARTKLLAASGVSDVPGRTMILANPSLAAYSTADGNVYVSMAWLLDAENEDEIAAILAHELAHVLLTHHSADMASGVQKRLQAIHEASVSAKMATDKTTTASKSDQRALTNVQLVTDIGDRLVMPAFNRQQEREADFLGVDLLVRAGYSPMGLVTLLEKQQAFEKKNRESEEAFQDRLQKSASTSIGQAIGLLVRRARDELTASHPDTGERIESVAGYIDKFHASAAAVSPSVENLTTLRSSPAVREVMTNYRHAFAARRQLDANDARSALESARSAASGRTAFDAYPNWVLAKAGARLGRHQDAVAALERAVRAEEPVREVYEELISAHEQRGSPETALAWSDKASVLFGDSERWLPTKIRLLRKLGRANEAAALTARCTLESPDWRKHCQEANATPAPPKPTK